MHEMSHKKLGMTCVVDEDRRLIGIVTDGDLRRLMLKGPDFLQQTAGDVMTRNPITVSRDTLAAEALHILEQRKITSVVVVDGTQQVQGVVHLHDLWRTEMI
jgi:arabinose-5-phosphate isomerase